MPTEKTDGLQVVSDLHLEFHTHGVVLKPCAPWLALLGDTGVLFRTGAMAFAEFLGSCSAQWQQVFVIVGNHEMYGADSVEDAFAELRGIAARFPNVVVLEKESFDIGNGYRVLGTALWSHIHPERARVVEQSMNDYALIKTRHGAPSGMPQKVTAAITTEWHRQSVVWLESEIARALDDGKKVVVLSHHAPIPDSNPNYPNDPVNCAFETDLRRLMVGPPVMAWFWGHTHCSRKMFVGNVLVQSNQYGYHDGSDCGFDHSFVFPMP